MLWMFTKPIVWENLLLRIKWFFKYIAKIECRTSNDYEQLGVKKKYTLMTIDECEQHCKYSWKQSFVHICSCLVGHDLRK